VICSNGYPCFGSVDLCRPEPTELARWLRVAGFDARHARELAARYHVRYFRVCWWQHYPEPGPKARKTKADANE
jgi:hypothetical protein